MSKNDMLFLVFILAMVLLAAAFAQRAIIGNQMDDIAELRAGVCIDPCPDGEVIFRGQEKYGEENVVLRICRVVERTE